MKRSIISILLTGVFSFSSLNVAADDLTETIMALDSKLFASANDANLEGVKQYFDEDLEFYHDTAGLADYRGTIDSLARMFANPNRPIRTLVESSTEVYPVPEYGAIQKGKHQFCHTENGKPDCGTFEFVHVWKQSEKGWKITRVLSYGH